MPSILRKLKFVQAALGLALGIALGVLPGCGGGGGSSSGTTPPWRPSRASGGATGNRRGAATPVLLPSGAIATDSVQSITLMLQSDSLGLAYGGIFQIP